MYAVWLAENKSVNPKSVISAISPVQNGEIESKTVRLKMIDTHVWKGSLCIFYG